MDRFAWLNCQPWLVSWLGCSQGVDRPCSPCAAGRSKLCEKVDWVFHGFASFHIISNNMHEQEGGKEGFGPLCKDAAHLFFSVRPPLSDPAQLVLRLGIAKVESGESVSVCRATGSGGIILLLTFDDSNPFFLEFRQVEKISFWRRDKGCSLCTKAVVASKNEDNTSKEYSCVCQQMPLHATVKLRHVALNIYSSVQSEERIIEHLQRLFAEGRPQSSSHDNLQPPAKEREPSKDATQAMKDLIDLVKHSDFKFQQFLRRIDCMSECALKAVEVCSADQPWMAQSLLLMAQHASDCIDKLNEMRTLLQHMHYHLNALQDEEKEHVATIWGCVSQKNQEAKAVATSDLQHARQQMQRLEEAILWLDLVCAAVNSQ